MLHENRVLQKNYRHLNVFKTYFYAVYVSSYIPIIIVCLLYDSNYVCLLRLSHSTDFDEIQY